MKHYQTFTAWKRVCSELQVNVETEFQQKYSDLPVLNKINSLTTANPFSWNKQRVYGGGEEKTGRQSLLTEEWLQDIKSAVDFSWNVMAHGDAREGKWRGNWWMEWVASTLRTTTEHGVSSITTAVAHTSAASSRLNWRPRRFKWTRPFCRKTKSGFCACAITFQTQSNYNRPKSHSEHRKWLSRWAQKGVLRTYILRLIPRRIHVTQNLKEPHKEICGPHDFLTSPSEIIFVGYIRNQSV